MSSSDSDSEIIYQMCIQASCATAITATKSISTKKGSKPGKLPNRNFGRTEGASRLDRDYFCRENPQPPLFTENEFERRYRVPREIYEKIRTNLLDHNEFFIQKNDAVGELGASTDLKLMAAFRMLCDGTSAYSLVESTRMGEDLNMKCLKEFTKSIVEMYEEEWLRRPSKNEIVDIEKRYSILGFPGCIGAVDCASWEWDNCPIGWQGNYKGKGKKPVCRMEVICDDSLRVWHLAFGAPGSRNDLTIMDQDPFFNDVRNGVWPPYQPNLCISGFNLDMFYYLADGIYPRYKIFALPLMDPRTKKERYYSSRHSSARKAVERLFGVLFRQFFILYRPSRIQSIYEMEIIVKACCIIHNMISAHRGYRGTMKFREELDEQERQTRPISMRRILRPQSTYDQALLWRNLLDNMEDPSHHKCFTLALIQNIWNTSGDMDVDSSDEME